MRKNNVLKLCSIFFICTNVWAGALDHLKPVPPHAKCKTISGVDFMYVINLDKRPERWGAIAKQFKPYGIEPYRYSAVNGYKLSLAAIEDMGVRLTENMDMRQNAVYFYLDKDGKLQQRGERAETIGRVYILPSVGGLGCFLSHLSIIKDAYEKGYETAWILEDDAEIIRDPHQLTSLIKELDLRTNKQWDILFTDIDRRNPNGKHNRIKYPHHELRPNYLPPKGYNYKYQKKLGSNFWRKHARVGAHSYIISRSGMKKFLDFIAEKNIFYPFDLEYFMNGNLALYSTTKDIVSNTIDTTSDTSADVLHNLG